RVEKRGAQGHAHANDVEIACERSSHHYCDSSHCDTESNQSRDSEALPPGDCSYHSDPRRTSVEKKRKRSDGEIVECAQREICNCCLTNSADCDQLPGAWRGEVLDYVAAQRERKNQ